MKSEAFEAVTAKIIADLETGVRPWMRPWASGQDVSAPLRANGIPYGGINVLMLWIEAMEKGYSSPTWMTFKQARELGGHVRKGEHGSLVVFAKKLVKTEKDTETGEESKRYFSFMRNYTVFNIEQIEGLPERFYAKPEVRIDAAQRIAHAEAFFAALGANIEHVGTSAYYQMVYDRLRMPAFESFNSPGDYYATLAHECVHWTRHESRLDRKFEEDEDQGQRYAFEELVAELGAAFLCAHLGLTPTPRADHAAYIGNWLRQLRNDKRAIFAAAAHAQRAVNFLMKLQPDAKEEPEEDGEASREAA